MKIIYNRCNTVKAMMALAFYGLFNPLSAKKSKVKVQSESDSMTAPHLLASPSLITSKFQSLVVSLSDIVQKRVFVYDIS